MGKPGRRAPLSKERVTGTSGALNGRAVQQSLDKVTDWVNQFTPSALAGARLIKDITLTAGETKQIQHGLGRELQGWWAVKQDAGYIAYDKQSTNPRTSKELWLTFDNGAPATMTLSIIVF